MTCNCPGPICTCDGAPKVKDGATIPLPLMMKDSAMTDTKHQITADALPTATMTLDEAMALPRYAGMWPSQRQQFAARDLALAKAGDYACGYHEGAAALYVQKLGDAWKDPNGPVQSQPVGDVAQAHAQMRADLEGAWKH